MMRTLQGQGPKVQSIMVDPVTITYNDLEKIMGEDCDPNSQDWLAVGKDRWGGSTSLMISSIDQLTQPSSKNN